MQNNTASTLFQRLHHAGVDCKTEFPVSIMINRDDFVLVDKGLAGSFKMKRMGSASELGDREFFIDKRDEIKGRIKRSLLANNVSCELTHEILDEGDHASLLVSVKGLQFVDRSGINHLNFQSIVKKGPDHRCW